MRYQHHDKLGQISAHLWGLVIPLLIGAVVGALLFFGLRRARLRWTWALLGAPLAYLLWLVQWHIGLAVATATAAALYLGIKTHDESLHHGGEEARHMRDSLGPLAGSSLGSQRAAPRQPPRNGRLAIGSTHRGGPCRVPFGLNQGVHALISGATGSGKTVDQAAFLQAYVHAGFAATVIDPKGDRLLRAIAERSAREAGVRFLEWTPTGPSIYNPLARGNPTEIAGQGDRNLPLRLSPTMSWRPSACSARCSPPFRLQGCGRRPCLRSSPTWTPSVSTTSQPRSEVDTAERVSAYVDSLSERAKADLGGGRDRLAVLADSGARPLARSRPRGGGDANIAAALRRGDVVYFNLDADRYPPPPS